MLKVNNDQRTILYTILIKLCCAYQWRVWKCDQSRCFNLKAIHLFPEGIKFNKTKIDVWKCLFIYKTSFLISGQLFSKKVFFSGFWWYDQNIVVTSFFVFTAAKFTLWDINASNIKTTDRSITQNLSDSCYKISCRIQNNSLKRSSHPRLQIFKIGCFERNFSIDYTFILLSFTFSFYPAHFDQYI